MAPIGEKGIKEPNNSEMDTGQNLWASILSEVSSHSSSKLPSCKSVLVLGEDESGKTSLVFKMRGSEEVKKGIGLEYVYLDVRDEDRDDVARCGAWILDGDTDHQSLLKFAVTKDNLEHTLAMIVIDLSKPWAIMESIQKWTRVLREHIDSLKLQPQRLKELEKKIVQHFQEYVEPQEGSMAKPALAAAGAGGAAAAGDDDKILLPLGETTLTHNLGIPLVIVCSKSDAISSLEKEYEYRDEHLDFIQQHIRKVCLNYGASLFYVSVKENRNCQLLYKYLVHRLYNFPFYGQAIVVEKDAVFIPLGWDNLKKISILYENMTSIKPTDTYEDVIIRPITRKLVQDSKETLAEDEQVFLLKQQTLLTKNIQPGRQQQDSPQRSPAGMQRPTDRRPSPNVANVSPIPGGRGKMEAGKVGAASSEGVLANFFNSLLSKKPGASSPGQQQSPGKAVDKTVRRDAAAELDRLTRARQNSTADNSSSS